MAAVRCLWCVIAVGALAFVIWAAYQPVGFVSLGCGKGGVLEETGTRPVPRARIRPSPRSDRGR